MADVNPVVQLLQGEGGGMLTLGLIQQDGDIGKGFPGLRGHVIRMQRAALAGQPAARKAMLTGPLAVPSAQAAGLLSTGRAQAAKA